MSNSFQDKLERGRRGGGKGLYLDWRIIRCIFSVVYRKMSLELEGLISLEEAYKWLFTVF